MIPRILLAHVERIPRALVMVQRAERPRAILAGGALSIDLVVPGIAAGGHELAGDVHRREGIAVYLHAVARVGRGRRAGPDGSRASGLCADPD